MTFTDLVAGLAREELARFNDLGVRLTLSDLRSRKRSSGLLTIARAAVARACFDTGLMTLSEIGAELGGRHHSTVHYWLNEVRDLDEIGAA